MPSPPFKNALCTLALGAAVAAHAAPPVITILNTGAGPQLTIQSDLGATNQIQYCTNLGQTNWLLLTNLVVTQSPYQVVDASAPSSLPRFYRVLALPANPAPAGTALIPAGAFAMGDALDGESDALPTNTVYESAYYMDTNLVSYALWQQVAQWATNHGYSFDAYDQYISGKAPNHPVQYLNWYDAVKWCNARSEMAGLAPCYDTNDGQTNTYRSGDLDLDVGSVNWAANGYRLPTEAEWEKAARGTLTGQRFPWGNIISQSQADYFGDPSDYPYDLGPAGFNAVYAAGAEPFTSPVGSFAPNAYGLYDMAGNVFEWCWDWYSSTYYGSFPGADPRGPALGSMRVARGGSWGYFAYNARCAFRTSEPPSEAGNNGGFRCVRAY
jgi:formylglycine-generating enzyme